MADALDTVARHPAISQPPPEDLCGISLRALVLTIALTAATYLVIQRLGFMQMVPPVPALLFLLILQGLNLGLAALARRRPMPAFLHPFSRGELLLIYAAICVAPCMDRGPYIFHYLLYPQYYGDEVNEWQQFYQYYPAAYIPQGPKVAMDFFEGSRVGRIPWGTWWGPLAWWTTLNMLLMLAVMCIAAFFRRQWTESERLNYPLLFLPLEITGGGQRSPLGAEFFGNGLMWLGFSAGAFYNVMRMGHFFIPGVPEILGYSRLGQGLVEPPLRWLRPLNLHYLLDVAGLSYLMSGEVLLSAWGSYFLMKAIKIGGLWGGYRMRGFPFYQEVSSGACIGMALFMIYVSRMHFGRVLRSMIRGGGEYDRNEAMSYRGLALGLIGSTAAMVWMLRYAGHRGDLLLYYFATLYMFVLVVSRMRAEAGPPVAWTHPYGYDTEVPVHLLGTRYIRGHGSLQPMVLYYALFWIGRTAFPHNAAQYFTDGLRLAEEGKARRRSLAWLMLLACLISMGVAWYYHLEIAYKHGQAFYAAREGREHRTWPINWSRWYYRLLDAAVEGPKGPDWTRIGFYAGGLLGTMAVIWGRMRIASFPFHPLGIVMGTLYNDGSPYWGPFLLAWIFQRLALHYGGLPMYRRLVPLFLGLFFGHTLFGGVFLRVMYRFLA